MAFSPDGTVLAVNGGFTLGNSQTLKLWSVPDWEMLQEIDYAGKGGSIWFSPDGQRIAVEALRNRNLDPADTWAEIEEYSVSSGDMLRSYGADLYAPVRDLVGYTPDGSILITGDSSVDAIDFWDTSSGELLERLPVGGTAGRDFWYSPDGRFLLARNPRSEADYLQFWGVSDEIAADSEHETGSSNQSDNADSEGTSDDDDTEEADVETDPNLTLVRSIETGRERSSRITKWANVNGTLFFTFAEIQTGSDTQQSRDAVAASPRSDDPSVNQFELTVTVEDELWTSDGTEEGTVRVKDLGTHGTYRIDDLTNVNGTLFL